MMFGALYAAEDPMKNCRLAPESESLALAHGCVNIVTGEFVQQEADLVIEGSSPLVHSRIYDSGNSNVSFPIGYGFTRAFPQSIHWRYNDKKSGRCYARMEEREGVELEYGGRYSPEKQGIVYTACDSILAKGYTNYSASGISGAHNLHNVELLQKGNGESFVGGWWQVTLGCGTKRIYLCRSGTDHDYDLVKEIRPNGNRVFYEYNKNRKLARVYLTDHNEKTPLIDYSVTYAGSQVTAKGSNGQTLRYMLDYNRCRGEFANGVRWKTEDARMALVEGDHLVPTRYEYPYKVPCLTLLGKITKVSRPEGRELHIGHHEATGKVRQLQAPIGTNNAIHPFATFNYPQDGICDVTGPSQERTRYLYSTKDHRITQKQE